MCGCNKPVIVQGVDAPLEPAPAPKTEEAPKRQESTSR